VDGDDVLTPPARRKSWIVFVAAGCVALLALQVLRRTLDTPVVLGSKVTVELREVLDPASATGQRVEVPELDETLVLAEPEAFLIRSVDPDMDPLGMPILRVQVVEPERLSAYRASLPRDARVAAFARDRWVGFQVPWRRVLEPTEDLLLGGPEGCYESGKEASRLCWLLRGE
jgi:hypothetical protein